MMAQTRRRRGTGRAAASGALAVALVAACSLTSAWRGFEERAQGLLLHLHGPRPLHPDVLVLAADDDTLRRLGWPLPRDEWAVVVDAAARAGAKAIAFDVLFIDPSRAPEEDAALAGVMAAWPRVVLPVECVPLAGAGLEEAAAHLATRALPAGATPAWRCPGVALPTLPLRAAAALAQVSAAPSASGNHRGVHLLVDAGGRRLPHLALAAYLAANGLDAGALLQEPDGVRAQGHRLPVDAQGATLVSYRGLPPEQVLSVSRLLSGIGDDGELSAELAGRLEGRILLVGQTAGSVGDHGPLITGEHAPLIALHAALLSDLLEGFTLRELAGGWALLLLVLTGALAVAAALWLSSLRAVAGVLALLGGVLLAAWALAGEGWLLQPLGPTLAGGIGFSAALAARLATGDRERRLLRSAFGAYVDPQVLERVLEDPDRYLSLGGAKKVVSVLFSDIQGYTGLSNELPPDQVVAVLREYLEVMTRLVTGALGRVDKIMGDGILAVFGDPLPCEDHALRAVRVGLAMQRAMEGLQKRWAAEGMALLRIRVGIATGEVFVGNIGSASAKLEYTVLGPTVNLASRLEGKAPPGGVLVCAQTEQACAGAVSFRPVPGLKLKGFSGDYLAHLALAIPSEGPERAGPRFALEAEVTVSAPSWTGPGRVLNLSDGGLFVTRAPGMAAGVVVDDPVEVAFAASGGEAPLRVRGRVKHVGGPPEAPAGFGLSVDQADAGSADALHTFVRQYLAASGEVDGEPFLAADGGLYRVEVGELYVRLVRARDVGAAR